MLIKLKTLKIMKKILVLFSLLFMVIFGIAQVPPEMRTKLVYDATACRYEVYVIPSSTIATFPMAGAQIVIAVPHNMITNYISFRRNAFNITTVSPTNNWIITAFADKDVLPTYSGPFDYYAVDNTGGDLGALTANTPHLLFHFNIGANCINGLRLWEGVGAIPNNYNDPQYPIPGSDFMSNIAYSSMPSPIETWVGNIDNLPTVLPLPTAGLTTQDGVPLAGLTTITAVPSGGAGCSGYAYTWSGTGVWLSPPGTNNYGIVQTPGLGTYSVQVADNNGCTGVASITLPLVPVELISFTATKSNDVTLLNWTTASEVNNNYFAIEHSTDAEQFSQIGKVLSKNGNSTSILKYDFIHTNPSKGINYYRLKQIDFDGSYTYSDVRSVIFGSQSGLIIYPNPTHEMLMVEIPSGMDENAILEITNATGQVVRSLNNPQDNGKIISLNVKDLADGYYFLQIKTTANIFREQFIVSQ